jgi:hypothetical protein
MKPTGPELEALLARQSAELEAYQRGVAVAQMHIDQSLQSIAESKEGIARLEREIIRLQGLQESTRANERAASFRQRLRR